MRTIMAGWVVMLLGFGGLVLAGEGEEPSFADLYQGTGDPVEDHIGVTMHRALTLEAREQTEGKQGQGTGVRDRPATAEERQAAEQQAQTLSSRVSKLETKFAAKFIEVRRQMTDMAKERAAERQKPGGDIFLPGLEEAKTAEHQALARQIEELRQLRQEYTAARSQLDAARDITKLRTENDIRTGIQDAERDAATAREALDIMTRDAGRNPDLENEPGFRKTMDELADKYGRARQQADELNKQLDENRYVGAAGKGDQETKTEGAKAEPETRPTTGLPGSSETTSTTGIPADQGAAGKLSRQEQDYLDYQRLQERKKTQQTTAQPTTAEGRADKTVTPEPETPPEPPGPGGEGIDPKTGRWEPVPQMVTRENEAYWQSVLNDPDKVLVPHRGAGVLVLTQKQLREILTEKALIAGWNEQQVRSVMEIVGPFSADGKRLIRELYKGEGEIDYTRLDGIKPRQPIDLELGPSGGAVGDGATPEAKVETAVAPEPGEQPALSGSGPEGDRKGVTADDAEFWTQAVTDKNRVIVPNLTDVSLTGDDDEGFIVMGAEQAQRYIMEMALRKGMSAEEAEKLAQHIGEFNKLSKAVIQQWLKEPEKEFDFSAVPQFTLPPSEPEGTTPDGEAVDETADETGDEADDGAIDEEAEEPADQTTDDLRAGEPGFEDDGTGLRADDDEEPSPLEGVVRRTEESQDGTAHLGVMRSSLDVSDASRAGDNDVRQADITVDVSGQDASRIREESTAAVAGEDSKQSLGNVSADGLAEGMAEGGGALGTALGGAVGDRVAGKVFGPAHGSEGGESESSSEPGVGAAGASASGGSQVSAGSQASGGDTPETKSKGKKKSSKSSKKKAKKHKHGSGDIHVDMSGVNESLQKLGKAMDKAGRAPQTTINVPRPPSMPQPTPGGSSTGGSIDFNEDRLRQDWERSHDVDNPVSEPLFNP